MNKHVVVIGQEIFIEENKIIPKNAIRFDEELCESICPEYDNCKNRNENVFKKCVVYCG